MKIMPNINSNRMRCAALALCTLAVGSTPIWSQATQDAPPPPADSAPPAGRPGMEHMQDRHIEMLAKHLNFTPDQLTQAKAISKDSMTQMMALHQDTSLSHEDKHAKGMAIHEAETAKIRAILTDDQKPKYDAMIAHEHERMEHHEDRDGGSAPPPPPAA